MRSTTAARDVTGMSSTFNSIKTRSVPCVRRFVLDLACIVIITKRTVIRSNSIVTQPFRAAQRQDGPFRSSAGEVLKSWNGVHRSIPGCRGNCPAASRTERYFGFRPKYPESARSYRRFVPAILSLSLSLSLSLQSLGEATAGEHRPGRRTTRIHYGIL